MKESERRGMARIKEVSREKMVGSSVGSERGGTV